MSMLAMQACGISVCAMLNQKYLSLEVIFVGCGSAGCLSAEFRCTRCSYP